MASKEDPIVSDKRNEVADSVTLGRAAPGLLTATGQAAAEENGLLDEAKENATHGSDLDTGPLPKPDFAQAKPGEPVGLQAKPALFAPNGALPENMVATNYGPVAVSAVTASQDDAAAKMDAHFDAFARQNDTSSRQRLTDEKIATMSGADLRAVGADRGYDISGAAGTRGTRAIFTKLQAEDKTLDEE